MVKKDTSKLKGKIIEMFGSQRSFANSLGVSEQSVHNKLVGKTYFSLDDIIDWCNELGIERHDVQDYFFAD